MNISGNAAEAINFTTSRFGPLTVAEEKVIHFTCGIPGFEGLKRFILIDHDPDGLFKWLQAVDDPKVAFLMTDPTNYLPEYRVRLRKNEAGGLGVKDGSDVVVLVMVCVARNGATGGKGAKDQKGQGGQISLNLKGPVVFNSANMRAMQCILDRDDIPASLVIRP